MKIINTEFIRIDKGEDHGIVVRADLDNGKSFTFLQPDGKREATIEDAKKALEEEFKAVLRGEYKVV